MVQVYRGDYAYLEALLFVELFGYRFKALASVGADIYHARIGLFARCYRGGRRGRVGGKGTGVIGDSRACYREAHEGKILGAVQHGILPFFVIHAGQGLFIILVGQSAQIIGGRLELRIAHSVPYEKEHIFG